MTYRAGLLAVLLLLLAAPSALADAPTATFSGHTLTITGTMDNDTITVGQVANAVTVDANLAFPADPDGAGTDCQLVDGNAVCSDPALDDLIIKAGPGADTLSDARSTGDDDDADTLNGEAGNDTISCLGGVGASDHFVSLVGGPDSDTLTKNYDGAYLDGGADNDTINGGTVGLSDDTGGEGDDTFTGAAQNSDYLFAEPGADTYALGTRVPDASETDGDDPRYQLNHTHDTLNYEARPGPVAVSEDGVANDGDPGENDNVAADVESVIGSDAGDVMAAGANGTELSGGGGDDRLTGGPGTDRLNGGGGSDTLTGGDGNDDLFDGDITSGSTADVLPPAGNDRLDGGAGSDSFYVDRGADDIVGGAGEDSVSYERPIPQDPSVTTPVRSAGFTITIDDVANDGVTGAGEGDNVHADVENLYTSGRGDDILTGSAAGNGFYTEGGNDTITPGAGADIVYAGTGDDTINAQDGTTDRIECESGTDTVVADLAGAQPERADLLQDCETVSGTPFAPLPTATPGPDVKAPGVTLSAKTIKVKTFLKRFAIPVAVTCDEACSATAEAFTGSASIAKVGQLSIGSGKLGAGTGKRTLTVKVTKKAFKRALKRKLRTRKQRRKGLKLSLTVTVRDAAGNDRRKSVAVRVRG